MSLTCRCLVSLVAVSLFTAGCGDSGGQFFRGPLEPFRIVSGSENEALEPILVRFAADQGYTLQVEYQGSVDIMLELQNGSAMPYDAIWPANSLWITLGDGQRVVRHAESVMHSPVVFGVKRSVAQRLGWLDREVSLADILQAAEAGQFRFAMTSATQSNSGASAYFGFLHALAGAPDVLTSEHLADPDVQRKTRALLKQIDRSSGSSGWLKDLLLERYDEFEAMVNYECMIIEANQVLVARGDEPLVAIYPTDAVMISDSPLGFIDHGDRAKAEFFKKLMEHLKSEPVQQQILAMGRRTGIVGLDVSGVNTQVFNPAWGIDITRVIAPVPTPSEPVLREALDLYQAGGLRKPSVTAFVLDFSGSMDGEGIVELKRAMALLLDRDQSQRFLLQPSANDVHIIVPFDGQPRETFEARGNDPRDLQRLLAQVRGESAHGGTDIYAGVVEAMRQIDQVSGLEGSFPAIILMTDGQSQGDIDTLRRALAARGGPEIPVFSITFGLADDRQLEDIARLLGGRVFDGKKDLTQAFRQAKGYN